VIPREGVERYVKPSHKFTKVLLQVIPREGVERRIYLKRKLILGEVIPREGVERNQIS